MIKEVATIAAKLAPEGAELIAEVMPQLAGTAIAVEAKAVVATAEAVLPKLELHSFSAYAPFESSPTSLKTLDNLFRDSSRHEFLAPQWKSGPTTFVDQWRYASAPTSTPLETNGLYACTALSITERSVGLHYLAHIDSDTAVSDIVKSVARFDFEKSSVRLLPGPRFFEPVPTGVHIGARTNVEKTVDALRQIPNGLKDFKFLHSTPGDYYSVVSHEGKLYQGAPTPY